MSAYGQRRVLVGIQIAQQHQHVVGRDLDVAVAGGQVALGANAVDEDIRALAGDRRIAPQSVAVIVEHDAGRRVIVMELPVEILRLRGVPIPRAAVPLHGVVVQGIRVADPYIAVADGRTY